MKILYLLLRSIRQPFIVVIFLSPFFLLLLYAYYQKIYAFGCFDDCFNFVGGYFLTKGKTIYSEFFYNHQMGMAYLSFIIQKLTNPQTIFSLVLYHRIALFTFSVVFDLFLIYRFRFVGLGQVVFYETTKYYLFGDRFLAEAFIVYPLVYLFGLVWYSLQKEKIRDLELLLAGILTWFVVFMREPYVPLALVLYGTLLFLTESQKRIVSLVVFFVFSALTILSVPLEDYFFNVVTINSTVEVNASHFGPTEMLKIFFYPFYAFIYGGKTVFRWYLLGMFGIFGGLGYFFFRQTRTWKLLIISVLLLGLGNLRVVTPGSTFYEAFHMLPWYGMFLFLFLSLLQKVYAQNIRLGMLCIVIAFSILLGFLLAPSSYIFQKVDRHKEYVTNYSTYFVPGEVIRILSTPSHTLFVDGWDELIYFQAKRLSPYRYTWYTSVMPYFKRYTVAREEMFVTSPPDFYYGDCPNVNLKHYVIPKVTKDAYDQFYFADKPTCLYVKKTIAREITPEQREKLKRFGYYLVQ